VGLSLALCLHKHCRFGLKDSNVDIVIYEQSYGFAEDVGAGMGLHPNGLRILRDVDLLRDLLQAGQPLMQRRWTRHDGHVITDLQENSITINRIQKILGQQNEELEPRQTYWQGDETMHNENESLVSIGIRRWKLQKVLLTAVLQKTGISISYGKRVVQVGQDFGRRRHYSGDAKPPAFAVQNSDQDQERPLKLSMQDGTLAYADVLFAADGNRSSIRDQMMKQLHEKSVRNGLNLAFSGMSGSKQTIDKQQSLSSTKIQANTPDWSDLSKNNYMSRTVPEMAYSGMSCVMGIAEIKSQDLSTFSGTSYPSSAVSNSHAVIFPTGPNELCFQYYFPVPKKIARPGDWSPLTENTEKAELSELATKLRSDGWLEDYIKPIENSRLAVRFGICLLKPKSLTQFSFNVDKRIVLLGDAAHPSIPYLGQGAQVGLEDVGTLALLLQHYCLDKQTNTFSLDNFARAMRLYDKIRIPRTTYMLDQGLLFGRHQEMRSSGDEASRATAESEIKESVAKTKELPGMILGSDFDYRIAVHEAIRQEMDG
jgi:2-polyprenyl-6-methoxyphenol hydroxylase-like FAD-dependent oxidoreductase